jgi:hypothetical protein
MEASDVAEKLKQLYDNRDLDDEPATSTLLGYGETDFFVVGEGRTFLVSVTMVSTREER